MQKHPVMLGLCFILFSLSLSMFIFLRLLGSLSCLSDVFFYFLCHHPCSFFFFLLFSVVARQLVSSGQVRWTFTGRNKTLPPTMSLPVMGKIAGVNTPSLGGYLHSRKKRDRWAEGFHDELNGHVFDLDRDGLHQVVLCL